MNRPPPDIDSFLPDAFIDREIRRRARVKTRKAVLLAAAVGIPLGILIAWALPARSEPVTGQPYVIDGDTIRLCGGETVRILNIDAPETTRAKCEAEAALGYKAKERLAQLLRGATITLDRCDGKRCTDPYGRTLARVFANGKDVGEVLITEGLATRWPKRFDGCGFGR